MSIEDEINFVIKKIRDIRVEKKISQMELANIGQKKYLEQAIIQNNGFCEQKLFVSKDMFKDENPKNECSCGKFERETSWE